MRARLLTSAAVCLVAATALAAPASADDRGNGAGGAYVNDQGDPTATAQQGHIGGASGGGGAGDSSCEWRVAIEDDFAFQIYDVDSLQPQHSATGRWLEYWCEGRGIVPVDGYGIVPEGGVVDPRALAEDALASVQIAAPVIRTSPSENGRLYVQVPTWLWIDDGWWRGYTATAEVGRVWSTVTARPVSVSWSLGDGNHVACSGPGTAWTPGADEDASDCSHTYRRSSAGEEGGTYEMSATVQLHVTWASNAGLGGALPTIGRTSTVEVEVGEIQAIGTRGGH